jgi:environmental stress-induced protein Ves
VLKIVPKSSYAAIPWKNGGGITHEAIRVPATGDSFQWRVSVAHIDVSGPFSDFSGYDRKLMLLRGSGVALKLGDGTHRVLSKIGDWAEFDGAVSAQCELLDGPCVDLNLMVARPLQAAVRVEPLNRCPTATAARGETTLIFSLQDPLLLDDGADETVRLEPWDLAVLSQGSLRLGHGALLPLSALSAVFIATISH